MGCRPRAGLAGFLGARHGGIGQRQQADLVFRVLRIDRDADRGADINGVVVDFKRRLQRGDQAAGDQFDLRLGGGAGQDGDEFIAADAGQRVAVAQGLAQALGGHAQHGVADRMAEAIVDFLEAVQADGGDGKPWPERRALAITMRMRSDSSRRLGSSVRPSWVAMWRSRSSVACCTVMSRPTTSSSSAPCGVVVGGDAQLVPDFDIGVLRRTSSRRACAIRHVASAAASAAVAFGQQLGQRAAGQRRCRRCARWRGGWQTVLAELVQRNTTSPASSMRLSNS
jgi:hypothetical protein